MSVEMPKGEIRSVHAQQTIGWRQNWQEARFFNKKGDYALATTFYDKVLNERPDVQLARWEYCQLAFKFGDVEKTEILAARLLEQDSRRSEYRFFIAQLYKIQGRLEESERIYNELYQHAATQKENFFALEQLITVFLAQDKKGKALPLLRKLIQQFPENLQYREELADLLLELGHFDAVEQYALLLSRGALTPEKAVDVARKLTTIPLSRWLRISLFEFYLGGYPQDRLARREVAFLYNELGQYSKALDHLLILCDMPYVDTDTYRIVAQIYNEKLQRPGKALWYYEKYNEKSVEKDVSGDIEKIQILLAADFSVLIENGGGKQLWTDLKTITRDPQKIFLKIAKNFRKSGKRLLALKTLTYIEQDVSQDFAIEIAEELLKLNEPEVALAALKRLPQKFWGIGYYKLKIKLESELGHNYFAYQDQLNLLAVGGKSDIDGQQLLDETFVYASLSGMQTVLNTYPDLLEKDQNRVGIARVYSKNALFDKADTVLKSRGDAVLTQADSAEDFLRAENYRVQSLWYEAEELYRKLLSKEKFPKQATEKLMELSFIEGKNERAYLWYSLLKAKYEKIPPEERTVGMATALDLLDVQLLLYENDAQGAVDSISARREMLISKGALTHALEVQVDEALCQSSVLAGNNTSCHQLLGEDKARTFEYKYRPLSTTLVATMPDDLVLSRIEKALLMEKTDHVRLLFAELDKRNIKTSYTNILKARFFVLKGDYISAAPLYQRLAEMYPHERFFTVSLALIEGKLGEYQSEYDMLTSLPISSPQYSVPATKISLQKARTLWRLNQNDASLAIYKSLQEELAQELTSIIDLPEQYFKKSYWQEVTTLFDNPKNSIDRIMDPGFLLTSPPLITINKINDVYSSYRWHRLISQEFQARNAAYQQRLVMAERNYRMLLKEKQAKDILPDLAPIYQRLGDYEREAKVYQYVQESGVNIDYLAASMDENQKQLQPKLDSFVHFSNRNGRGGSIDMKKYQTGVDFGFTPHLGQEYHLSYVLTDYNGDVKSQVGQLVAGRAQLSLAEDVNVDVGLGFEKTNHNGELSTLGHVVLNYRVLDHLRSYVGWNQSRVDDTIESVNEDLLAQDINLGAIYESPKGLDLGIEYIYRFLSDSNEQERFNAWTEYTFFSDQAELGLRYDFEFFAGKNTGENLSYWNPDDFRKQSFSLSFRYNLNQELEEETLKRYYEVTTRLGIEDDNNMSYTTEFDIFLEMNPQFLLKGSLLYSKSDSYDESAGMLHLVYRW